MIFDLSDIRDMFSDFCKMQNTPESVWLKDNRKAIYAKLPFHYNSDSKEQNDLAFDVLVNILNAILFSALQELDANLSRLHDLCQLDYIDILSAIHEERSIVEESLANEVKNNLRYIQGAFALHFTLVQPHHGFNRLPVTFTSIEESFLKFYSRDFVDQYLDEYDATRNVVRQYRNIVTHIGDHEIWHTWPGKSDKPGNIQRVLRYWADKVELKVLQVLASAGADIKEEKSNLKEHFTLKYQDLDNRHKAMVKPLYLSLLYTCLFILALLVFAWIRMK